MDARRNKKEARPIRVVTVDDVLEGELQVGAGLRTLDDLNLVTQRFVMLHSPKSIRKCREFESGPVAINKNSILFVCELDEPAPLVDGPIERFTCATVRLQLLQWEIEGFVHVPPGGAPLKRFDQERHPFVSLTSALVTEGDEGETAAFVAVNCIYVSTAQAIGKTKEPRVVATAGSGTVRSR
jgi:hypothetical protein